MSNGPPLSKFRDFVTQLKEDKTRKLEEIIYYRTNFSGEVKVSFKSSFQVQL